MSAKELNKIASEIHSCSLCPRLISHCREVARVKRKSYLSETYWGKPISGFGDANARMLIVGLAPAAHGANRTGRIFTGDRSGEWLFRALHRAGFANQPESLHLKDGLQLFDTWVTCVVRCAPPDNKPELDEIARCAPYLIRELQALKQVAVIIALGQIALHGVWPYLAPGQPRPKLTHGDEALLPDGRRLLMSYHPSQQNTFTGRLTQPMFDSIFARAKVLLK